MKDQGKQGRQGEQGGQCGSEPAGDASPPGRGTLIRDSLVFQFKLLVDGSRDLLLVPVSLVATVISFVAGPGRHGLDFYSVLRFGKRTEYWIDLFGAAERGESQDSRPGSLDAIVDELEAQILDGAPREELPSIMREKIDKLRRRSEEKSGGAGPQDQ